MHKSANILAVQEDTLMINEIDISTFLDIDTVSSVESKLVDRFKKRRKELKLSQKALSDQSGVAYASIRRFEKLGEISLTSLIKLAIAMDSTAEFNMLFSHSKTKNLKDME